MTILETFQHRHADDLALLNERIALQLASSNPMMSSIVGAQLRTKGKQLRPLLLMVCARMFGPVTEKVVEAAAAVELLHNASLIHDDVVDNAFTRRGKPTVNAVWDNHIAVLVGDFFTSSAMQEAIATGDIRIVESLCSLGRHLSLGEIDQIFNAREHSISKANYMAIIDYKTASLFVSSARMGCLAAGVDDWRMTALEEYARAFGRCFQIRDDIFAYSAGSAALGKPTGNDLREGKITLPLLAALEAAPESAERSRVVEILDGDSIADGDIAMVMDFARRNGGIELAQAEMENLRGRAVEALAPLDDSEQKRELIDLLGFIIDRTY